MKAPGQRFPLAAQIALGVFLASAPLLADMTKDQCIEANGKGQDYRREGRLSAAREQLRLCAAPSCPAMVRDDCTKRLDDLERAQPTIAFEVKDATGADVSAVKVSVDGKPLANRLGGTALPVDVGEHVFTFAVAGQTAVTRTFVVTEGEKGRRERITLGGAPSREPPLAPPAAPVPVLEANALPPAKASGASAPEPVSTREMGTQKILGLIAGGAGLASLGAGSVFGVMTISEKNQQHNDCATSSACTSYTQAVSDHSTGMTYSTISTIGFVAGGALLVGGVVLFFTGHAAEPLAARGMLVVPTVGPGSEGISLSARF